MSRKIRLKLLKRIAQAQGSTTGGGPQGAPTTSGSPQGAQPQTTTQVTSATPSLDVGSIFTQIDLPTGWDSSRVPYIKRIVEELDRAVNISTNGKITLRSLWPTFPSGVESNYTSPTSDVLVLLRKVYVYLLNRGIKYTKQLSSNEVSQRVNILLQAPELAKLIQINPNGPLGKASVSLATIRQDLTNMMPPPGAR